MKRNSFRDCPKSTFNTFNSNSFVYIVYMNQYDSASYVCFVYAWSVMLYMFNRIDFVLDLLYKSVICWELNWHSNTWNKKVFVTFAQNAYLNTPLPLSDWIKFFFRFLLLANQLTFFRCIHAYSRVILQWIHALYYLWLLIGYGEVWTIWNSSLNNIIK